MGMRFRKSIKLGKHVRLNLSKSGIGYSVGTKGFRVTKMANGRTRTTTSIPGTGISHVSESRARSASSSIHTYDPAPVRGAPRSVFSRFIVAMLVLAASVIFCIVIVFLFGFFSDLFFQPSSPDLSPPRLSFAPLDPIVIAAGESVTIKVTADTRIDTRDIDLTSDESDIVHFSFVSAHDYYAEYRIHADEPGSCCIVAQYSDIVSPLLTVTVVDPYQNQTTEESEDIPQSPVYWFIVNTNTKVIHRASCSRAPSGGNQTTEYAYYIGQGYKHCSYCFD